MSPSTQSDTALPTDPFPSFQSSLVERLNKAGIANQWVLATTPLVRLLNAGFSMASAKKVVQQARDSCAQEGSVLQGDRLRGEAEARAYLTTGTQGLNQLLGGTGFQSGRVYQIYGAEGVGKTILLHQLICTAMMPSSQGGLDTQTLYIDTNGSFSSDYLTQLAPRFGLTEESVHLHCYRFSPPTSDVLLFHCERLERLTQQHGIRFICLDALPVHFLSEYSYTAERYALRQQVAYRVVQALRRVAQRVNGVVVFVNWVSEFQAFWEEYRNEVAAEPEFEEMYEDEKLYEYGNPCIRRSRRYREPRESQPRYWDPLVPFSWGIKYEPTCVGQGAEVSIFVRGKRLQGERCLEYHMHWGQELPPGSCMLKVTNAGLVDCDADGRCAV